MSKLTPEQVFEHVKALWPSVDSITKVGSGYGICHKQNEVCSVHVDWPEGVTEWPMPPKWELPSFPDDFNQQVRFRDHEGQLWRYGILVGYNVDSTDQWIVRGNGMYESTCCRICEIDRNLHPVPRRS